ncbi:MAG: TerB family tellurite resistance protein [Salibacteraceae bacterium]
MSFGKWIGGSIGWSIGGPIGAIAGFALGALFDNGFGDQEQNQKAYQNAQGQQQTKAGDFGMSMVILSAAVMKADNKIMKSELDFVKAYLVQQFGQTHAKELISALKEVLKTDVPVRQVCLQIRANMSHPMRLQLLHYLFGIGYADGVVGRIELNTLNTMARYLGISQKDFFSINAMFGGGQGSQSGSRTGSSSLGVSASYKILEIDSTATDSEVKKAYRKMAKKYHPDKVAALGPDFQNAAKEKFQKVQQAYEEVKDSRGMN